MKSFKSKINHNWFTRVKTVSSILDLKLSQSEILKLDRSLKFLEQLHCCQGDKGVKLWKSISSFMTRWLITGVRPDSGIPKVRIRNGVPRYFSVYLRLWRKGKRSEHQGYRILVTTLLNSHNVYDTTKLDYSISSVIRPSRFSMHKFLEERCEASFFALGFWEKISQTTDTMKSWKMDWKYVNKSGPNHSIGILSTRTDFHAVSESRFYWALVGLLRSLLNRQEEDPYKAGEVRALLNSLVTEVEAYGNNIRVSLKRRNGFLWDSKLSFIPGKSGKTRTIAIGDAWSQFALRPMHDQMFKILREVFHITDGTFDQDKQKDRVSRWAKENRRLFCYDLSSATDRLPLDLQRYLLEKMKVFSSYEVGFWHTIMGSRTFRFRVPCGKFKIPVKEFSADYWRRACTDRVWYEPWHVEGMDFVHITKFKVRECEYSVGQPMGLLTSFAMLALTHHIIIQLAAYLAGRRSNTDKLLTTSYAVLGDDVVIADEEVAKHYLEIMTDLDVTINFSKSYTGKGLGEFAKALFSEGHDVSPIPCGALRLRPEAYLSDVLAIHTSLRKRGYATNLAHFVFSISPGKDKDRRRKGLITTLTCPTYKWNYDCLGFIWDKSVINTWKEVIEINSLVNIAKNVNKGDFQLSPDKFDPYPESLFDWVTPQGQYVLDVSKTSALVDGRDWRVLLGEGFVSWSPDAWGEIMYIFNISSTWIRDVKFSKDEALVLKKAKFKTVNRLSKLNRVSGLPDYVLCLYYFLSRAGWL